MTDPLAAHDCYELLQQPARELAGHCRQLAANPEAFWLPRFISGHAAKLKLGLPRTGFAGNRTDLTDCLNRDSAHTRSLRVPLASGSEPPSLHQHAADY